MIIKLMNKPLLVFCCLTACMPVLAEPVPLKSLGQPVSKAEIKRWDIDIKPDGSGLPKGRGSVFAGEQLYQQRCVACHGEEGVNGTFDTLVGRLPNDTFPFGGDPKAVKTIGNYWPYATTLYDYINRAMPFDAPGSLSADEVYGLVAYLLHLNKIIPVDMIITERNLASINMPARDRFVPQYQNVGTTKGRNNEK